MKVLIIEDQPQLRASMAASLSGEGLLCEEAADFESAREKLFVYEYDLVVLDIGLPGGSGLTLLEEMKESGLMGGVLIVSAKGALDDKLTGLSLGADDYLSKPFHLAELNARAWAILRRCRLQGNDQVRWEELLVNTDAREVRVHDQLLDLTAKEYELLLFFITNPRRVLSKEAIAEHLWGDHMDMADHFDFLYTHIKNLRKKIMKAGGKDYVQNVYGIGYKFTSA
jgi:DNA-binding response OmpR family regulator